MSLLGNDVQEICIRYADKIEQPDESLDGVWMLDSLKNRIILHSEILAAEDQHGQGSCWIEERARMVELQQRNR